MARARTRKKPTTRLVARRLDRCGEEGCAIARAPAGFKLSNYPGFKYTSGSARDACRITSRRCPVQLVFDGGKLSLRLCEAKKGAAKGKVVSDVAVKSPAQAQRLAAQACACWKRSGSMRKCGGLAGGRLEALRDTDLVRSPARCTRTPSCDGPA